MPHINPNEALQRINAQTSQAAPETRKRAKATPIEYVRTIENNLYLFQRGKEGIIAPADDTLQPIIADCQQADFQSALPTVCEEWLIAYSTEITDYQIGCGIIEEEESSTAATVGYAATSLQPQRQDIPYLVKTKWSQEAPYNKNLKFAAYSEKCLVGCVAVTIGQLLHYWGTKGFHRGCTATTKYKYTNSPVTVEALPPITHFDYPNLNTSTPKTKEQISAVATLLEYAGKACQLKYSPTGTGGYMPTYSKMMRTRLRMGQNISCIAANMIGMQEFDEKIYNELAHGRPVAMSGVSVYGGHSFICDGYRSDTDMYHFNWGWGGSYNGWYAMSALTPKEKYAFDTNKKAVIGIKPDYALGDTNADGDVTIADIANINSSILQNKYSEAADINHDGTVSVTDTMLLIDHILGKNPL